MVRILSYLAIVFISLAGMTFLYFQQSEIKNSCQIKILTSNSFYNGVGKDFKSLYLQKHNCELNFTVVSGANLITNLFLKKPNRFDILIGLDVFQIQKMDTLYLWNIKLLDIQKENEKIEQNFYVPYDESPITFFIRNSEKSEFETLDMFLHYAHANKLSLAVPLKTTSVLGSLFDIWLKENVDDMQRKFTQIKYVKSWSEAFGLFERKIVDGFLSFETSEIFYINESKIKKIKIHNGHPNLKEYYAYSSRTSLPLDHKINFYNFIKSEEAQSLILKKNYMWPLYNKKHDYQDLRNLKTISLDLNKASQ